MKRIWTPWRMDFILGEKSLACIFCDFVKQSRDRENLILYRGEHAYIIMNRYPYTSGHLMVIPYEHSANMEDLAPAVAAEVMLLLQRSVRAIRKAIAPQGFNVGANMGKVAGAGIDEHFHMHIVPRWQGDSNFMPVVGETRLIPELLEDTFDRLIAAGIGEADKAPA